MSYTEIVPEHIEYAIDVAQRVRGITVPPSLLIEAIKEIRRLETHRGTFYNARLKALANLGVEDELREGLKSALVSYYYRRKRSRETDAQKAARMRKTREKRRLAEKRRVAREITEQAAWDDIDLLRQAHQNRQLRRDLAALNYDDYPPEIYD